MITYLTVALGTVIGAWLLTTRSHCGHRDYARAQVCTVIGRHDQHVWTNEECLPARWRRLRGPARWFVARQVLRRPDTWFDWRPSMLRREQLWLKALLAALFGRYRYGYPFDECGLHVTTADAMAVWGERKWTSMDIIGPAYDWTQADVCVGWTRFHVHVYENSSA